MVCVVGTLNKTNHSASRVNYNITKVQARFKTNMSDEHQDVRKTVRVGRSEAWLVLERRDGKFSLQGAY